MDTKLILDMVRLVTRSCSQRRQPTRRKVLAIMVKDQRAYLILAAFIHCITNIRWDEDKCFVRIPHPDIDFLGNTQSLSINGDEFSWFGGKDAAEKRPVEST